MTIWAILPWVFLTLYRSGEEGVAALEGGERDGTGEEGLAYMDLQDTQDRECLNCDLLYSKVSPIAGADYGLRRKDGRGPQ